MKIYFGKSVLFEQTVLCATFFKRLKGLMFKKKIPSSSAYLFYPGGSIHTFFMRFEISIIFLNKQKKILKIKKAAKNKIIPAPRGTEFVIETADYPAVKEGDILNFDLG